MLINILKSTALYFEFKIEISFKNFKIILIEKELMDIFKLPNKIE